MAGETTPGRDGPRGPRRVPTPRRPSRSAAPFDVIGPPGRILAMVGDAAELPCRLSSNESAARMELRWFREPLSPAVLAHPAGLAQDAEQMAAYRGRAELVRDDIARGRVALRLRPVRASDAGEYRCAFRQGGRYAEARASLAVAGERPARPPPRPPAGPPPGHPHAPAPHPLRARLGRPGGGEREGGLVASGGGGDPSVSEKLTPRTSRLFLCIVGKALPRVPESVGVGGDGCVTLCPVAHHALVRVPERTFARGRGSAVAAGSVSAPAAPRTSAAASWVGIRNGSDRPLRSQSPAARRSPAPPGGLRFRFLLRAKTQSETRQRAPGGGSVRSPDSPFLAPGTRRVSS